MKINVDGKGFVNIMALLRGLGPRRKPKKPFGIDR
jgi:hypothetical protein